ncbi:MliC family protein [Enterobacillus tribolii]|uniref:Membrane-bound inhibitor of C-type lysozyme n=1 Tax=Enterobacillus tribolii TaxID=1487935 RepID=A0A370R3V1_9GAMM|nr:MliC family protein [Enterobacillus tribolii]MBW7984376.1 hypothetical protein [Enterobacillus tribolii]RDK97114.1 membrane-bound inhibitor of C-type lysozyme [Enterobacillus tribolii]
MIKYVVLAGAVLALSGCHLLRGGNEAPEKLSYQCGTMPLTVSLDKAKSEVSFIMDGTPLTLPQTVSASGARYSNGTYTFWSKGNKAFIERNDKVVVDDCTLQPAK